MLITVYFLISLATIREVWRDSGRRWLLGVELGTGALGLAGLVLDLVPVAPAAARRWWWVAVAFLAVGMAVSFACSVQRALARPVLTGSAERQAFWLLLAGSALVLVVDLAVLWVGVRFAASGASR